MKGCMNCKYSYKIISLNYLGCKLVDNWNNRSLKTLGEEGKCPYYKLLSTKG